MWYVTIGVAVIFSVLNPLPMIPASTHIWTKFKSSSSQKKSTMVLLGVFITIVFLTAVMRVIAVLCYLIYLPYDDLELDSAMLVRFIPDVVPLFFCVWYAASTTQKGNDHEVYHAVSDVASDNMQ